MMESTKFRMNVYMEGPAHYRNETYYRVRDNIREMKPSNIRDNWWVSHSLRILMDTDGLIELEGTVEQFKILIEFCNVKVKWMFTLPESLFIM